MGANSPATKTSEFSYDANGNLLSVYTGKRVSDTILQATNSRKMMWDEENRLLAVNDNGFVSNFWYDAAGERTVKMSGDAEGVFVNGVLSGGRTGTANFTAYVSPYLLVRNGGYYTKNVYMGSERIVSKLSSSDVFAASPLTTTQQQAKYSMQTAKIKERFDSLGVVYRGTEKTGSLLTTDAGKIPTPLSYFYHADHLGSSSLITDQAGSIIQHLEYVPFGETFIDERNGNWNTPYTFSGKERDEETGLLYVHARYQDSKYGVWYSVDPLAEKYPNWSSYNYCFNNPVKFVDLDGREPTPEEAVLMAKHAYGGADANKTQEALNNSGWSVSNIKTSIQKDSPWYGNGLQSQIYEKTTDGKTEYAYVFAGTNSLEDVAQDGAQLLGASTQYEQAVYNTRTLSNELGQDIELTLVGHSLGGGEAAAGSMATGRKAITFNPASVSDLTKQFLNLGEANNVTNYITIGKPLFNGSPIYGGGDPLNNLQNNAGLKAPGKTIYVPTNSFSPSHSIDSFLNKKLQR